LGALTLKSFPFELRGWDIEKFESIDPTDGFGSNTRVYISKDLVVQIEPDYDIYTQNSWITDKGRQFFDGIFGVWNTDASNSNTKKELLPDILKSITRVLYMFDHCHMQKHQNSFTLVFENVSLEVLSILQIISQRYSFIKIRRAESFNLNNDLESNYQLNITSHKTRLSYSTLCMLVSTNPRYEGFCLNLNLRQRHRKGNFKCLTVGSLINLTFPTMFLGSNLKIIKTISEGNHLICQDLKFSKNPIIVINSEVSKRHDYDAIFSQLKTLNRSNVYSRIWNGLNLLSSSLSESGNQALAKFLPLTTKDLTNFSALYFINVTANNNSNLKKVIELKTLNDIQKNALQVNNFKLFLDQNSTNHKNSILLERLNTTQKILNQYFYLPSNVFYENEETFINTEGFFKRTTKLIFRKKTKSNWQILRKFLNHFKSKLYFLNKKDNLSIVFNSTKITNFKTYSNFQYYATQTLTNLNFYFCVQNQPFSISNTIFKQKSKKVLCTKVKYWLDDFFSGGKDEYSQKSLILTNCSRILRSESTNFF
jgi:NADH dehydrogenase/NADH:ubiquinone oxidoreductase subunit G